MVQCSLTREMNKCERRSICLTKDIIKEVVGELVWKVGWNLEDSESLSHGLMTFWIEYLCRFTEEASGPKGQYYRAMATFICLWIKVHTRLYSKSKYIGIILQGPRGHIDFYVRVIRVILSPKWQYCFYGPNAKHEGCKINIVTRSAILTKSQEDKSRYAWFSPAVKTLCGGFKLE